MLKALLTDIDGTITDPSRRLNTDAIIAIRSLVDEGIEVVLASGNTACFMDALCKMVGTKGTFIAENGGVFRIGFTGTLRIKGDQGICRKALEEVQAHYRVQGKELVLFSPTYRFSDLAFARTVPVDEVKQILRDYPVTVLDTGYAIHLQSPGVDKGTALVALAHEMNMVPSDFLAVGDSLNDIQMLKKAGIGVTVANAHPDVKAVAEFVAEKEYGNGFVEVIDKYFTYFRARKRSTTI
ncbi:MAG: phosphoglycolate phosphatase [Methanoregula sp.]|nr:phosphoglycolate phosphatase [Methanoregula sp.]